MLKALALGAKAVFLGRPVLYGLAIDGQKGVERVVQIMNDELKRALVLTGCLEVEDIRRQGVLHL